MPQVVIFNVPSGKSYVQFFMVKRRTTKRYLSRLEIPIQYARWRQQMEQTELPFHATELSAKMVRWLATAEALRAKNGLLSTNENSVKSSAGSGRL